MERQVKVEIEKFSAYTIHFDRMLPMEFICL